MIFNMLKFHSNFIAKKMSVWSILLQNGTSAFPGCYWAFSGNFKDVLKMFKVFF